MLFGFFVVVVTRGTVKMFNIADLIYAEFRQKNTCCCVFLFSFLIIFQLSFTLILFFWCSLSLSVPLSLHMLRVLPAKCAWER